MPLSSLTSNVAPSWRAKPRMSCNAEAVARAGLGLGGAGGDAHAVVLDHQLGVSVPAVSRTETWPERPSGKAYFSALLTASVTISASGTA